MNKKEVNQRIHNLEEELAELKSLLDQTEGRWRANPYDYYYYVGNAGSINKDKEDDTSYDHNRYESGNYFQTEEHAKESNIYKLLNSEYDYYIAGVSDNYNEMIQDESLEVFDPSISSWVSFTGFHFRAYYKSYNYRLKRK